MEVPRVCACQEVLMALGLREKELNDQIWPWVQGRGVTWAQMTETLARMKAENLVTEDQRRVDGHRLALFYKITATGHKKLKEIQQGGENATATDFGENCCLKAA